MIFEKSLRRELNYTAGSVFLILLTIMLTMMMIRIVGFAALGQVATKDMLVLIGLTVVSYLAVMMTVTLFVSILFVLTRWHKDSEMVVWFSSGMSLTRFIKPILQFSAPILVLITFLILFSWPWANEQMKLIRERFQSRSDVSMLSPGQFIESKANQRVFFIENMSPSKKNIEHIFVASTDPQKLEIVTAESGSLKKQKNNNYIVLNSGQRYDGSLQQMNFKIMSFEQYLLKIAQNPIINTPTSRSSSTLYLLKHADPTNLAELVWRLSMPFLAFNLMLIAIPLSHQNPRRGRTVNFILAVLIYLIYSNLLNLLQTWGENKRAPIFSSFISLHIVIFLIAMMMFWLRISHRSLTDFFKLKG